jgi:hypothetical protein
LSRLCAAAGKLAAARGKLSGVCAPAYFRAGIFSGYSPGQTPNVSVNAALKWLKLL